MTDERYRRWRFDGRADDVKEHGYFGSITGGRDDGAAFRVTTAEGADGEVIVCLHAGPGVRLAVVVDSGSDTEILFQKKKPPTCCWPLGDDTGGFRIGELSCPIHGDSTVA